VSLQTTPRPNPLSDDGGCAEQPARASTTGHGRLVRLPVQRAVQKQRVLAVWFRSPDERSWYAIGGGATVAQATTDARQSLSDDMAWDAVIWNDLHGD
jgi:hypothetical protein